MTLRFLDSFDDRSTAQLFSKYNSGSVNTIGAFGRNGTQGMRVVGNGTMVKTFDNQGTWILGFAMKPNAAVAIRLALFTDAGTVQCSVQYNVDGSLTVHRAAGALATTSAGLALGVWTYVEIKIVISATVGTCDIYFDGISVMHATGLNISVTGNSYANSMRLFESNLYSGSDAYIDDFYVCDVAGAVNNNFLGDIRVECLLPNADANYSQWNPNIGTNEECVDDPAIPGPDGDTTYNETYLLNARDSFDFPALTTVSGTVVGVAFNAYMRKTDAGARGVKSFVRTGGLDYDHADTMAVADTYAYEQQIAEEDPSDSNPWTVPDINAIEAGYKLES